MNRQKKTINPKKKSKPNQEKKGLQKLSTEKSRVNELLEKGQVKLDEYEQLTETEQAEFTKLLYQKVDALNGKEQLAFMNRFDEIWTPQTKNRLWENNQIQIMGAVANLIRDYNRMPSCAEISKDTGLSRQTIQKHLKNFSIHPIYLEQMEQFRLLTTSVLASVYKSAIRGDIGASKLYFNFMGCLGNEQNSNNTLIQNQTNYIQINKTVLSQETIKQLSPEQLNSIEDILKTALPQPNTI